MPNPSPIRIIGIDPGLQHTGWGIIDIHGNQLRGIAHGTISPPVKAEMSERLAEIYQGLCGVLAEFKPAEAAVEESFMNNNAASALKLGMARGVAMLAPGSLQIPVAEYSARSIKKSVVGTGTADKTQIAMMVSRLLPQCKTANSHEADALAIAICHAHHRRHNALTARALA